MSASTNIRFWCAGLLAIAPFSVGRADEPAKPSKPAAQPAAEEPALNLLDAAKSGVVTIQAEGTGEGRMILKVTNQTNRKLKVVLPPGLVASGATGQMGGMGGMGGGGMGGGGMGGGGMGGGGMGGGGMGGGGMGGGGMGGGGGQGGGQLTMPATMGLMLVGRLIMSLVETHRELEPRIPHARHDGHDGRRYGWWHGRRRYGWYGRWNGWRYGGMGGGMRSVPPTDLPNATLNPRPVA